VRKISGSGGLTIKTREGMTRLGDRLDDGELRYLHYMVKRALVGFG
jgi:hypothetical protein